MRCVELRLRELSDENIYKQVLTSILELLNAPACVKLVAPTIRTIRPAFASDQDTVSGSLALQLHRSLSKEQSMQQYEPLPGADSGKFGLEI